MTNISIRPTIDPNFQSRLRSTTITTFETSQKRQHQGWQLWLPLTVGFAAVAIFLLTKTTTPLQIPPLTPPAESAVLEQELAVIEQQLLQDIDINNAIDFTNL